MQDRSYEEYREYMNETMRDDISNLKYYCSDSEYEKSGEHHDIFIDAYEKTEPLYDLYLLEGTTFKEGHLKIYEDINMARVTKVINEHNKTYILDPKVGLPYEFWIKAEDKGTHAIAYRLIKREEQANG